MPAPFDRVETVFFDIDNTLYDFDASVRATLAHVAAAHPEAVGGRDVADLEVRYHAANQSMSSDLRLALIASDPFLYRRATWLLFLEREAAGVPPEAAWDPGDAARLFRPERRDDLPGQLARTFGDWRFRHLDESAYPGARETVAALLGRGRGVGIITNGPSPLQRAKFRALGYEGVIPEEMVLVSGEFGAHKPDRSIFEEAVRRAGVPAERIAFVGDSVECDVASKAVGMRFIFFDARRGPRPDFKSLCGHEPDAVAHDYDEVRRLLGL